MKSIAIFVCYLGKLPDWFCLWLKSCEYNSTIDFYVYTDQEINFNIPSNVKLISTELTQLKDKFSKVLGFECELSHTYKLCDYKVIYGITFYDIVKDYDFWGHCDIDMIFGDLRKFITDDILSRYDRIFEVGHLSLYRNCDEVNNAFRLSGGLYDYKQVFTLPYYCGFDEHTGITRIFAKNNFSTYANVVCADINPHYRAFYMMDEDTVAGKCLVNNYEKQIFYWDTGHTYQTAINENGKMIINEVSYVHFMRKYPCNAQECIDTNRYIITYKEFISCEKILNETIEQHCFSVRGLRKELENFKGFIMNGLQALKRGQFRHRLKLRIQRIKLINKINM